MAYYRDEYVVTAAAEAAALVRRLVPAGLAKVPWTALTTPVDGNWADVWRVYAMQLEVGNSGTTDRQAALFTLELMGSPRVSSSLMHVATGLCGMGNRLKVAFPGGIICSGVAWFGHHHAVVENDVIRLKILYQGMKGVNYETW